MKFRPYLSQWYWRQGLSLTRAAAALFSAMGALWLSVEVVTYFDPTVQSRIESLWWLFILAGVVAAIWVNRPRHEIICQLSGRDIRLRLLVGDIFEQEGALVVGSNTTFDTDIQSGLIDRKSIQGQATTRLYDSVTHLDTDLAKALVGLQTMEASAAKPGKSAEYAIGTVARVAPKGRTLYFLAIASLNDKGTAVGSFDELQTALPRLWEYISNAGTIEPIVIPVLGSGFSRLPEKREEIVRAIIDSFVAACAARRFTDCLTIVIYPPDFYDHAVDLRELGSYLAHVCRYTEYGVDRPGKRGIAAG